MTSEQLVTWDCVYFGSYPQTEIVGQASQSGAYNMTWEVDGDYIVDDTLYNTLKNSTDWDINNNVTIDGTKYKRVKKSDAVYSKSGSSYYSWDSRIYHYFRYDPIKWRVLNVNGDDVLILADKALDDKKYNESSTSITWEKSTVRSWLNGYDSSINKYGTDYSTNNFIDSAFTSTEKNAIKDTNVVNSDNISYGTSGGIITTDKIFLLSESEVYNTDTAASFGFVKSSSTYDEARRCESSTYAKAMGACISTSSSYLGNCDWWLRSPGSGTPFAAIVNYSGDVDSYGHGVDGHYAVRPALHLNLSSNTAWKLAGKVNSKETSCGHSFTTYKSNNDATCDEDGTKTGKCTECGQTVTVTDRGSALGHTEVIDKAVKATCTETGLTAGKHCSVCGEVIIEQQVTDALGHDMSDYISDNNATCTTDGTKTSKCSRCDESDTIIDEGTAKGHTEVIDNLVPATCTSTGLTQGSHCSVCNEILKKQEIVPILVHIVSLKNALATSFFAPGYTGDNVCSVCGTVISKGSAIAKRSLSKPSLKVKTAKKSVKIKIGKVTGATKYEVKYKQGSKWKTKVISGTSLTIKKLKSKKKVTIQVRAIVVSGSNKVYSSPVKKTVKVK